MKKITVLILVLLAGSATFAQNHYYQDTKIEVLNMWTGVDTHPTVELQFLFIK